jgi:hypothetical protein
MPIHSKFSSAIILADGLDTNVWILSGKPESRAADSGWDTWIGTYVMFSTTELSEEDARADFPMGMKLGDANLWVQGTKLSSAGAGVYLLDVSAAGLLAERGYRASITSASETVSIDNFSDESSFWKTARITDASPVVNIEYIVLGPRPSTEGVGTAIDPPAAYKPDHKPDQWGSLADPTKYFPNGWLLNSRELSCLTGVVDIWLVGDKYRYQPSVMP